jgi:hypothetical protein
MVLGLLTVLAAYQLGHFQFYLPLILIIPLAIALTNPTPAVANSLMSVVALVSLFAFCYELFGGLIKPPWLYIRQNCSLPTVIAEVTAIVAILQGEARTGTPRALRSALEASCANLDGAEWKSAPAPPPDSREPTGRPHVRGDAAC